MLALLNVISVGALASYLDGFPEPALCSSAFHKSLDLRENYSQRKRYTDLLTTTCLIYVPLPLFKKHKHNLEAALTKQRQTNHRTFTHSYDVTRQYLFGRLRAPIGLFSFT